MTNKQFSIFMFINLFKQTDCWLMGIDGMKHQQKQKLTIALNACKNFFVEIEADLEKSGNLEQYYEDGEYFSRILELIKNAETVKQKQELIIIMREYLNGNLKITEDEKLV